MQACDDTGRAMNGVECSLKIVPDRLGAEPRLQPMAVAVDRDLMAAGRDLGRDLRVALDLLSGEEKDRLHGAERFENRGRALGVRAVVERERHPRPVEAPAYAG